MKNLYESILSSVGAGAAKMPFTAMLMSLKKQFPKMLSESNKDYYLFSAKTDWEFWSDHKKDAERLYDQLLKELAPCINNIKEQYDNIIEVNNGQVLNAFQYEMNFRDTGINALSLQVFEVNFNSKLFNRGDIIVSFGIKSELINFNQKEDVQYFKKARLFWK